MAFLVTGSCAHQNLEREAHQATLLLGLLPPPPSWEGCEKQQFFHSSGKLLVQDR